MPADQYLPNTSDFIGRWQLKANASNDYMLDPDAQKQNRTRGLRVFTSRIRRSPRAWARLLDRTVEHLGTADVMIIRTRQRLAKAAEALQNEGAVPPGADNPEVFAVRTGSTFLKKGADWLKETEELRRAFVEHPDLLEQAEAGRF